MSADLLLAKLERVRETAPDRWIARCPAHADKSPSLSIRELPDGTVLLRCFAGCGAADVVEAVGLTFAALFPPKASDHRVAPQRRPFDAAQVLLAIAHEALVVAMVAEECAEMDQLNRERLTLACERIHNGLDAVGPLPEMAEVKRVRRGELVA
jgi:hypothetical protein